MFKCWAAGWGVWESGNTSGACTPQRCLTERRTWNLETEESSTPALTCCRASRASEPRPPVHLLTMPTSVELLPPWAALATRCRSQVPCLMPPHKYFWVSLALYSHDAAQQNCPLKALARRGGRAVGYAGSNCETLQCSDTLQGSTAARILPLRTSSNSCMSGGWKPKDPQRKPLVARPTHKLLRGRKPAHVQCGRGTLKEVVLEYAVSDRLLVGFTTQFRQTTVAKNCIEPSTLSWMLALQCLETVFASVALGWTLLRPRRHHQHM